MKIVSIKSLGMQETYSPEMRGSTHNYKTAASSAIHANSHGVSYCMVAFRCLYLKAHFAPEWWASVMSDCKKDKMIRYMGVARSESCHPTPVTYSSRKPDKNTKGIVFDTIDINSLNRNFSVIGNVVTQGLIGIDGIGESACQKYEGQYKFNSIYDFMAEKKTNKTEAERFIKLGAFKNLPGHGNSKALWMWYQYHHCNGKEFTALRKEVDQLLAVDQGWTENRIKEEIAYQIKQYTSTYPKRKKIPVSISKFKPDLDTTVSAFNKLYPEDFTLAEKLEFQKDYLGFFVDSPMDLYESRGTITLKEAKERITKGIAKKVDVAVLITDLSILETKTKKQYAKMTVNDGSTIGMILMWENELRINLDSIGEGKAVKVTVEYDRSRGIYTVANRSTITVLENKNENK